MTPQIPLPGALRVGYSGRTKASLAAAAFLGWLFTWSLLSADASLVALLPATLATASTLLLAVALRSGFTIDGSALHHTTWRGRTEYPRSEFLAAESIDEGRGKSGLLLRFRARVVLLSGSKGCSDPMAIRDYLERNWGASGNARRDPAGPIEQRIELEYEPLQPALLALATLAFAAISSIGGTRGE